MIVIEINKNPFGYYKIEYSKSINNAPSTKFNLVDTVSRFETAINEVRKLAASYKKEGHSVILGVYGVNKNKNGRYIFGADKKFHKE